jgi:hypothetical protein
MVAVPPPKPTPVDPNTFSARVDDASHKHHYSFPFRLNADKKLMTITTNGLSAPFIAQGLAGNGYPNAKAATDLIAKLIADSGKKGFIVVSLADLNGATPTSQAPASVASSDTPPSENAPQPQAPPPPNAAPTEPKQALTSPQTGSAAASRRAAVQAANAKRLGLDPKKKEVATLQRLMATKEKMPISIDKSGKGDNKAGNETMSTFYDILLDSGSYKDIAAVDEALKTSNAIDLVTKALGGVSESPPT